MHLVQTQQQSLAKTTAYSEPWQLNPYTYLKDEALPHGAENWVRRAIGTRDDKAEGRCSKIEAIAGCCIGGYMRAHSRVEQ